MQAETKNWHEIPFDQRKEIISKVQAALSDAKLKGIKVQQIAQTVGTLKGGISKNDCVLVVEGKVPRDQHEALKAFQAKFKELTAGAKQNTVAFEVECAVTVGTPYAEVKDIVDIYEEKTTSI